MKHTDVVVIGGGIVGALVTSELLTQKPDCSIALVDKSLICQGASMFSAGVHFPRGLNKRVRDLSTYSHNFYEKLLDNGSIPARKLPVQIYASEDRLADIERTYLPMVKLGTSIPPKPSVGFEIKPPENITRWEGVGCHYTDVKKYTENMLNGLRGLVDIYEGVCVLSLQKDTNWTVTLSTKELISCSTVVVAPGPYINEAAWKEQTKSLDIRIKKIVAAHISLPPDPSDRLVVFDDEDAFLLPNIERNHWLFSYTCDVWDVEPHTMARSMDEKDLMNAKKILARYSPTLSDHLHSGRVFCDAYSSNREPIVKELEDNLFFAGATSGSGYRLAPGIANELINLI